LKYEGIKVFKDLKDQSISDSRNTISIETLDSKGAIVKIYKMGELVEQKYLDEKVLENSKLKADKNTKFIIKSIKKLAKNPSLIQKDKKFLQFQRKVDKEMSKKSGGDSNGSRNEPTKTEVIVQQEVMDKLQNPKILRLQEKISKLESELKQEVDNYFNSWWLYNGFMAVFNCLTIYSGIDTAILAYKGLPDIINGLTATNLMYYGSEPVLTTFIVEGFAYFSSFITNLTAFFFSTEDLNMISIYAQYIMYSIGLTSAVLLTNVPISPFLYVNITANILVPVVGLSLTAIKHLFIANREKSQKELSLEKQLEQARQELIMEME
jgi:hypothetical protein